MNDEMLQRALEDAPRVTVDDAFAARVMAALPKKKTRSLPAIRTQWWGEGMMLAGAVMAVVLCGVLQPAHDDVGRWLLYAVVTAELCGVGLWWAVRMKRRLE